VKVGDKHLRLAFTSYSILCAPSGSRGRWGREKPIEKSAKIQ
jgi:hypothetical protein